MTDPQTPATEAGRNLLGWRGQHADWTEARWRDAILAIEAEARADTDIAAKQYEAGLRAEYQRGRADERDLKRREVDAIKRGLPTHAYDDILDVVLVLLEPTR